MKKLLTFILCLLMIASVFAACDTPEQSATDQTAQTEAGTSAEDDTPSTPSIPPEQAVAPDKVIESLDANAAIMDIGTQTKQVLREWLG